MLLTLCGHTSNVKYYLVNYTKNLGQITNKTRPKTAIVIFTVLFTFIQIRRLRKKKLTKKKTCKIMRRKVNGLIEQNSVTAWNLSIEFSFLQVWKLTGFTSRSTAVWWSVASIWEARCTSTWYFLGELPCSQVHNPVYSITYRVL